MREKVSPGISILSLTIFYKGVMINRDQGDELREKGKLILSEIVNPEY